MKKKISLACAALALVLNLSGNVSAAENAEVSLLGTEPKNPVCVLMKFTDDTRFQNLDTSDRLSENLMVKLLQSGKFNLQDHQEYVDGDMEKLLFEDNYQPLLDGRAAIEQGDFNAVFESPSFSDTSAQSLATANVGQIVAPAVTARIGAEQNAEYLIQGTVQDIGIGTWQDEDFNMGMNFAGSLLESFAGPWGSIIGNVMKSSNRAETGFGILADVRIIKAATGEVVWNKRVYEKAGDAQLKVAWFSQGSREASAKAYDKTIEKVSDKITKDLLDDMKAQKLFQ